MPRSAKGRWLAAFKSSVTVDLYQAEFEMFHATRHLDVAKLSRAARAQIEIGALKTDCCKTIVRASNPPKEANGPSAVWALRCSWSSVEPSGMSSCVAILPQKEGQAECTLAGLL